MSNLSSDRIDQILMLAASHEASDVHCLVGNKPIFRIQGQLITVEQEEVLSPESMKTLVYAMLRPDQIEKLNTNLELDLAYQIKQGPRFRINIHWEKGNLGMVARVIPTKLPNMADLTMPKIVYDLIQLRQGLILVTGPTGSGKSSSLAAMINEINKQRKEHIITLEDPIEYVFPGQQSIIRQRELYRDFRSFGDALKHVVRQDPNIIMVGEMRDLETIAAALTVAETGHLVLATLHTMGSSETVDRIIDVFPPHQQDQIRVQLSMELRAVISQQLLPCLSGGRIAAREIMMNTPAISNLIRENKISQIRTVLQTSADSNMITLDQSIKQLFNEGQLSLETATSYMTNPELLD